ncbi:hypothetical protein HOY82DRAFT_600822 [Tuber indicum]|nr:hypothetical protein HOY82DRAFT_600822 [Tuber indicum]
MGNLCSRSESTREMRIEIEELRKGIARLERDREVPEVPEVQVGGGRATVPAGRSSAIYHQATTGTRMSRPVGRFGSVEESRAAEEFVARVRRSRNYGRDRS